MMPEPRNHTFSPEEVAQSRRLIRELVDDPERFKPRVHPNGFVQVDVDKSVRVHFWHPNIPIRQKTFHSVHDHIFGFRSMCVHGRLVNVVYRWEKMTPAAAAMELRPRAHRLHEAVGKGNEESVLRDIGAPYGQLVVERTEVMQPGDAYMMAAGEFHETLYTCPTTTIIEKDAPTIHQPDYDGLKRPYVAVPYDVKPDNAFSRHDAGVEALRTIAYDCMGF